MTSKPPAVIQTLIDAHINGFNTQDNDLFVSVFGDTAIIIDGIAPYRWLNPNAPANWLADVEKWRAGLGGGPAWFYLFHSDFHRAPTADHARTRFPDSSAT